MREKNRRYIGITDTLVYEIKKIINDKIIFVMLICAVFLGMVLFAAKVIVPQFTDGFSGKGYKRLVDTVKKEDIENEYENLSNVYQDMFLEGVVPREMYETSYRQEIRLYEEVLNEIKNVIEYKKYISKVLDNSQKGSVGIFARNKAVQKEQNKIYSDFKKVHNLKPEFVGGFSINMSMKSDVWDFLIVMILLILVHSFLISDIENNRVGLLRCTKLGEKHLVYAKFVCGCLILILIQIFMYICRFFLAGSFYGIPDLNGIFQNILGTKGCTLKLTIIEAMMLFIGVKLLVTLTLFSIFFAIGILAKSTSKMYIVSVAIIFMEWILYRNIDANSSLALFKWLNQTAFFDVYELLSSYKNLNICGYIVQYRILVVLVCVTIFIVMIAVYGTLYHKIMPHKEKVHSEKIYRKIEGVISVLTGGRRLTGYEVRKCFFYQKGFWIIIVMALLVLGLYTPVSERLYTQKEIYYKHYVQKLEGKYSKEKLKYLYKQKEYLEELKTELQKNSEKYDASILSYYSEEIQKEDGLNAAISYAKYLEKKQGSFVYEKGYRILFGYDEGNINLLLYRVLGLVVMTVLSAFIWLIEKRTGMNQIVKIAVNGGKKLRHTKRINILLAGFIITIVVYVPWIYNVYSVYGFPGFYARANSLRMFCFVPNCISILVVIIAFFLGHLIYLWIIGKIAEILSNKTDNNMIFMLSLFMVGIIPIILLYLGSIL